jgi:hypothetical protein
MQYILILKKKINKLLTFYNYKFFLDVDVRLFFMPFYCLQALKNNRIFNVTIWAKEQIGIGENIWKAKTKTQITQILM